MMKGIMKNLTKEVGEAQAGIGEQIAEIKELLREQNDLLRQYLEPDKDSD